MPEPSKTIVRFDLTTPTAHLWQRNEEIYIINALGASSASS
jgi:hypothetical protein